MVRVSKVPILGLSVDLTKFKSYPELITFWIELIQLLFADYF